MPTAVAPPRKLQRIEARLRPDQKSRIERAANIRGLSITDFIVQQADEAARHTIQQHETWELNATQSRAFVEACLKSGKPGKKLKAAAKLHHQIVEQW